MSKDTEIYQLLKRFAEDRYTLEDVEWIRNKIEDPYDKNALERGMRHYWYQDAMDDELPQEHENIDLDACLEKIHVRINQNYPVSFTSSHQSKLKQVLSRSLYFYYRAAAILLIPLIGLALIHFIGQEGNLKSEQPVYSEIYVPMGSRIQMGLPDGTQVWLNHGSRLRYPQSFGKANREVFLTGEAYFEVQEDKHKDFHVNTDHMDVRVTGTRFNMQAYPEDEKVSVSLDEGSVELYKDWENHAHKRSICKIKPGEHAVYDISSNQMEVLLGRNDIYTAWREGKMIFRDTPLSEIVKKLQRWYNVDIILEEKKVSDYTFTATFSDETLPQILHLLSKAAPLEYETKPRIKQEDHTFSKKQVIISLED